ncbi:trypsin-like serine protease [Erythrobacter sp. KY5]|uniref:trypsin-like serine protease n=1 Tax=Erythrobacter sp. KY5 TaxID=2011159 RepID=UPI0013A6DC7C|nr:trypsin-like serine protease [Erythrobacter sp. KY5]
MHRKYASAWLVAAIMVAPFAAHAQTVEPELKQPNDTPIANVDYERIATTKAPVDKSEDRLRDEAATFAALQQACAAEEIASCGNLGKAYERGEGTPQNRPIAGILLSEACDAGDARSCLGLGELLLASRLEQPGKRAFTAFSRACELDSLDGCASVARAYRKGDGVEQDVVRANELARAACDKGGGLACRDIADQIASADTENLRVDELVALYTRACFAGDAWSCSSLPSYSGFDDALPSHPGKAELFERGCQLDDAFSCIRRGEIALSADSGYRNFPAAMPYYDRACYLQPDRLCWGAQVLRQEPIESDACQFGDNSACARLAEIYYRPNTPFYDPELAQAYYEYACYAGATEACAQAGQLVLDESGPLDAETVYQGIAYLERGCAAEHLFACSQLAEHLERGEIIARDMARHYELSLRLCDANWGRSCQDLENAFATDPDAPLTQAGIRYPAPVEEGDTDWMDPYLTDQEREDRRNRCATSEIEFRGTVYTDTVCVPQELVIGGRSLQPGAAPWQALIWRPERGFGIDLNESQRVLCGGSLIATGWILTAAHCLNDDGGLIEGRGYTVRLGVHDPHERQGFSYPIVRVYDHPLYDPDTFAYDIALIRYNPGAGRREGPVNSITSIAIDQQTMQDRVIRRGAPVYVYGFGRTQLNDASSTASLQSARLLLESQARCNSITEFPREQWNTMLCAAGPNREQACKGDSGGPLITYSDEDRRPRVIGVVSSGRSCGQTGEASRYTRVAAARDWLDDMLGIMR